MTKEQMIEIIVKAAEQGASPENIRALCDALYRQWQASEAARSAPQGADREPDNQD